MNQPHTDTEVLTDLEVNNNVCVYLHINPELQEIFYVGIGNKYRPYSRSRSSRGDEWIEYAQSIYFDYNVIVIKENLSYAEAGIIEKKIIKQVGRKDKGLGTLLNKTNGGEGNTSVMTLCQKIIIMERYVERLFVLENDILKRFLECETELEFQQKFKEDYDLAVKLDILDNVYNQADVIKQNNFIERRNKTYNTVIDETNFFIDSVVKIKKLRVEQERIYIDELKLIKKEHKIKLNRIKSSFKKEINRKIAEVRVFSEDFYILDDNDEISFEYKKPISEIEIEVEVEENPDFEVFKNIKSYLAEYEKVTGIKL